MFSHSKLERFRVSKEQLANLESEFRSEALPMLDKLYQTSFWILLSKRFSKRIVKQTFFEVIEDCNITKNETDWQSWIYRIWIREIKDFYVKKENDDQTIFDFIDHAELNSNEISLFTNSANIKSLLNGSELIMLLEKVPAVLRVPLIIRELLSFNYEKIALLIDVPYGVIATRIYRARKLLFLSYQKDFNFEVEKRNWVQRESIKKIFELRNYALFVDDELTKDEKTILTDSHKDDDKKKNELLVQSEIKKLLESCSIDNSLRKRLKSSIERKAQMKFG